MSRQALATLSVAVLLLGGCSANARPKPAQQPEDLSKSEMETLLLQSATTTEVFHLRSECVALGNKVEADKTKDLKETDSVAIARTNYSVSANRCYVLIAERHELTKSTALYDGQTEEALALTVMFNDGSPSRGYMVLHSEDGVPKQEDYSRVANYIRRMMDDEQ